MYWLRIRVPPKFCQDCGNKIRRVRRKSWRKGYLHCPNQCEDWYGDGVKKEVRRRR